MYTLYSIDPIISKLKHYLPAQAPLKDFIYQNTLSAFQDELFMQALFHSNYLFGYVTTLSIEEYRGLYLNGKISDAILNKIIATHYPPSTLAEWKDKVVHWNYNKEHKSQLGKLVGLWKKNYDVNMTSLVHPILFRLVSGYLDQGVSLWHFPSLPKGFIESVRFLESQSYTSFFKTEEAKRLLFSPQLNIPEILQLLVGDNKLFEQYLFDITFAHPGWSGMVATIESNRQSLLDQRRISLYDFILLELLLQYDALIDQKGNDWESLSSFNFKCTFDTSQSFEKTDWHYVVQIWQEAYEWSFYEQVLNGIKVNYNPLNENITHNTISFQALMCIDDREGSLRRYLEITDNTCLTYGTPGFFGVEFYYQPHEGKFLTKLCPAPIKPKHLIKEIGTYKKQQSVFYMNKNSHSLVRGTIMSLTYGFIAAIKLLLNVLLPAKNKTISSADSIMEEKASLTIINDPTSNKEFKLTVGFTHDEMANRVENVLKSIGLTDVFAPLIYIVGHGSTTVNNPHYAAYDCGACSGRPGNVNARVFSFMANNSQVREILKERGLLIPATTCFVAGFHDTSRDEIHFLHENSIPEDLLSQHKLNKVTFHHALALNAKERSRKFANIDTLSDLKLIHDKIKERSVSLFEPRPELDHANNALCLVGRRTIFEGVFYDRRAFMNSYDYTKDIDGTYLQQILLAATPVCGGINLNYYFSRVDNHKLGAGSKLPHNVNGLIGVANGADGDLRPGLPLQKIDMHDPIRMMMLIEQTPLVVEKILNSTPSLKQWYNNEWLHLVILNPFNQKYYRYTNEHFYEYNLIEMTIPEIHSIDSLLANNDENIPIHLIV
jgi:uncharacterized protein YbcC (UPF0753/DUF2309 family)